MYSNFRKHYKLYAIETHLCWKKEIKPCQFIYFSATPFRVDTLSLKTTALEEPIR